MEESFDLKCFMMHIMGIKKDDFSTKKPAKKGKKNNYWRMDPGSLENKKKGIQIYYLTSFEDMGLN